MKKLSAIGLFLIALMGGSEGCGRLRAEQGIVPGITANEENQTPAIMMLPNDAGVVFDYHFPSRDLNETESFKMLNAVLERIAQINANPEIEMKMWLNDKVVIFAYEGKTQVGAATADFANDEVELWVSWPDKDWYVKTTFRGDIETIIQYLSDGVQCANPQYEEGKASEEIMKFGGKKQEL